MRRGAGDRERAGARRWVAADWRDAGPSDLSPSELTDAALRVTVQMTQP